MVTAAGGLLAMDGLASSRRVIKAAPFEHLACAITFDLKHKIRNQVRRKVCESEKNCELVRTFYSVLGVCRGTWVGHPTTRPNYGGSRPLQYDFERY